MIHVPSNPYKKGTLSWLFHKVANYINKSDCKNYICLVLQKLAINAAQDSTARTIVMDRLDGHYSYYMYMCHHHSELMEGINSDDEMVRDGRVLWCLELAKEFKDDTRVFS